MRKSGIFRLDYIGRSLKPNNDLFIEGSFNHFLMVYIKVFAEYRSKCPKWTLKKGFVESKNLITFLALNFFH